VEFYKQLFGDDKQRDIHLELGFWSIESRLKGSDRRLLVMPFSEKEVALAIGGMKTESALGPNGMNVLFFKHLWQVIKGETMGMVKDFNNGTLDLKRLNYGVITLVPKVKEANSIR
jgi:hypothetical protein